MEQIPDNREKIITLLPPWQKAQPGYHHIATNGRKHVITLCQVSHVMENIGPLLYIHGFASSGHSHKGQLLRQHFEEVYTPSLSHIPALAIETLEQFVEALPQPPLLLGSSLGGYYALFLSQRLSLPAVLINPVVTLRPGIEQLVGMQRHYFDGSHFEFTESHLQSLHDYHCPAPRSDRLLLMVQMGDEVIDHHQTLQHLPGAQQLIELGGDHAFQGFENHMSTISNFARACPSL